MKSKNQKKNISSAIVSIKATFNNTMVSISDEAGNVIASSTAGSNSFKGARKSTPHAAQVTVSKASEIARNFGVKTVSIRIKGPGMQRESAMRSVFNQGFIVTSITDVSPVPHNGVRPPKRRRM